MSKDKMTISLLETMKPSHHFILLISSLVTSHYCAHATWSIAGADTSTGQVGGSGASCIADLSIREALYNSAPGHGVLLSQALLSSPPDDLPTGPRAVGVQMLMNDSSPQDILDHITQYPSPDSDCDVGYCSGEHGSACGDDWVECMANPIPWCGCCGGDTRQYGIADLNGRAVGYTGQGVHNQSIAYDGIEAYEGHFSDYIEEGIAYSVQGNTVTKETVTNAYSQFSKGCDLADRLMNALEGGAYFGNGNDGDVRCQEQVESPAFGAFLRVESSDGSYVVDIDVMNDTDAINTLRRRYDDWRSSHPCNTTKLGEKSVSAGYLHSLPTVMWLGSFLVAMLTFI